MDKRLSITIDCDPGLPGGMVPYAIRAREGVGIPFSARLTMLAPAPLSERELGALAGREATVELSDGTITRAFTGAIAALRYLGTAYHDPARPDQHDACCYELEIASGLCRLRHTVRSRSFVREAVPDTLAAILAEHGLKAVIDPGLLDHSDFRKNRILTQIDESDYDFICRLCLISGINLTEDTLKGPRQGAIYLSDSGKGYRLRPAGEGDPGDLSLQAHSPHADDFARDLATWRSDGPGPDQIFTYHDGASRGGPGTLTLAGCFGHYETIKEEGSDDLCFVDMGDERITQECVRGCLAPRAHWSFTTTSLGAMAGSRATLRDFCPGGDPEILITSAELSYNINYPQDFALHPAIAALEASVAATVACEGISLTDKPARLPVLGDAGDPLRLLGGRALTLEGTVCDGSGSLERCGQRVPCSFDHPGDPTFFYLLPRGGDRPVVVRNSGPNGTAGRHYFPCVGDHALVVALGGRLQLWSYHPVPGHLSLLESTGMGTLPWLDTAGSLSIGGHGAQLRLSRGPGDLTAQIEGALIRGEMHSLITGFGDTHLANTAQMFFEEMHAESCAALRQEYRRSLAAYRECRRSLIGKFRGLELGDAERQALGQAHERLVRAHGAIAAKARELKATMFDAYEPQDPDPESYIV
ncbi:MAG: hypothetical protein K6A65_01940 [Succinivibrionaceae bacterium]|nr:hypothetical protein [Succinivibrionaceae bacterium]